LSPTGRSEIKIFKSISFVLVNIAVLLKLMGNLVLICVMSVFIYWMPCMIFEHFATNPDPLTEFIKLGSAITFKHFATNLDQVTEFIQLGSTLPNKVPLWCQN
jgi:hypothetical protein